jgi:anti-sigma factor RsiW
MTAAAAAVFAALFAGGAIGWFARGASAAQPSAVEQLIGDALEAHRLYVVEVRHPVEVPGNEKAHLVQWLSKRLEAPLRAPDLDRIGLKLVGGRLLPGAAQPAAFFMYEAASGERFTLYTRRANAADSAMRYDAPGQHGALYWIDHAFGFVVSGRADRARLQEIATLAYEQIEPRGPARRDGT